MAANKKTIQKMLEILRFEVGRSQAETVIERLLKETVPSGNSSYDTTIHLLYEADRKG